MSKRKVSKKPVFPEFIHVTMEDDGDEFYPLLHETLKSISHGQSVSTYQLVSNGTLKETKELI